MRSVIYSMGVSLDGYIVGPDGGFEWTPPDQDLFQRHWTQQGFVTSTRKPAQCLGSGPALRKNCGNILVR